MSIPVENPPSTKPFSSFLKEGESVTQFLSQDNMFYFTTSLGRVLQCYGMRNDYPNYLRELYFTWEGDSYGSLKTALKIINEVIEAEGNSVALSEVRNILESELDMWNK